MNLGAGSRGKVMVLITTVRATETCYVCQVAESSSTKTCSLVLCGPFQSGSAACPLLPVLFVAVLPFAPISHDPSRDLGAQLQAGLVLPASCGVPLCSCAAAFQLLLRQS